MFHITPHGLVPLVLWVEYVTNQFFHPVPILGRNSQDGHRHFLYMFVLSGSNVLVCFTDHIWLELSFGNPLGYDAVSCVVHGPWFRQILLCMSSLEHDMDLLVFFMLFCPSRSCWVGMLYCRSGSAWFNVLLNLAS